MITFVRGNLLDADVEALVNTVNTVGVMGKGIALMFKEAFPENFRAYAAACKRHEIEVGRMFVTEQQDRVHGTRWIVNFPTKQHWRSASRIEWVESGLIDLKQFIVTHGVRSIALPPLGSGNGGLNWRDVRPLIESGLQALLDVDIRVYEPASKYLNVAKRSGLEALTPARALVSDLVRRYSVLGFDCTLLEIHKLAYFLERKLDELQSGNVLDLEFRADRFGPYAPRLQHLLDGLDVSYLHCAKRVADAGPLDTIWFDDSKKDVVATYLRSEAKHFRPALDAVTDLIAGFESPLGIEVLGTVDWLLARERCEPNLASIKVGLGAWPGGERAAERKLRLFEDRMIEAALDRLVGDLPTPPSPD